MTSLDLPDLLAAYFAAKSKADAEETLSLFAPDAVVWDNGEDLELSGIEAIRGWMTGTVSTYELTTTPQELSERDGRQVVRAIVAGNFPGSPYAFDYVFLTREGRIAELAIDPIGPV